MAINGFHKIWYFV